MSQLKAIKTVYSYYFPEVRQIITDLVKKYPHEVFLQSVFPGLDDFHKPIIEKYLWFQDVPVPSLQNFAFSYPTAGAEEGIREVLTQLQGQGVKNIYVWRGEYEGFKEVAKTRCIETMEVDFDANPRDLPKGWWFLSNPSARDGNIIPNDIITGICEAGHQVLYDLSYLRLTELHQFDVSHPNIRFVVTSFSKPYGLFYYRIGFTFSREAIPCLYANKWFKNIFSLLIAKKIMEKLHPQDLFHKYQPLQEKFIKEINRDFGLGLQASDALLLAYLDEQQSQGLNADQSRIIEPFKRGDGYRFCLTPYFEKEEKMKQVKIS